MAVYYRGRFDTQPNRAQAFPANSIGEGLCLRHSNLDYYDEHPEVVLKSAVLLAVGLCNVDSRQFREAGYLIAIMETIAPEIPRLQFLPTREARIRFIQGVLALFVTEGYDSQWYDRFDIPNSGIDHEMTPRWPPVQPQTSSILRNTLTATNLELAVLPLQMIHDLAEFLAEVMGYIVTRHPTDRLRAAPTQLYCMMYLGLAKRGQITDNKLTAIKDEIFEINGKRIPLTPEDVKRAYAVLGRFVDETNAARVFGRLSHEIVQYSIRMNVTLIQSAGSGLTTFNTCRSALVRHPTFPWPQLRGLIPTDFARFRVALVAVGNNVYYGFRKDLGPAKGTLFPSLAYTCKTLLLRWNAADFKGLNGYKGIKDPNQKAAIDALITAYNPDEQNPANVNPIPVGDIIQILDDQDHDDGAGISFPPNAVNNMIVNIDLADLGHEDINVPGVEPRYINNDIIEDNNEELDEEEDGPVDNPNGNGNSNDQPADAH